MSKLKEHFCINHENVYNNRPKIVNQTELILQNNFIPNCLEIIHYVEMSLFKEKHLA